MRSCELAFNTQFSTTIVQNRTPAVEVFADREVTLEARLDFFPQRRSASDVQRCGPVLHLDERRLRQNGRCRLAACTSAAEIGVRWATREGEALKSWIH